MGDGLRSFISGGFGGCCSVVASHPLDVVKVRLQTSTAGKYGGRERGSTAERL
eukprot:gene37528-61139_t